MCQVQLHPFEFLSPAKLPAVSRGVRAARTLFDAEICDTVRLTAFDNKDTTTKRLHKGETNASDVRGAGSGSVTTSTPQYASQALANLQKLQTDIPAETG
jgi:hypothetical protein